MNIQWWGPVGVLVVLSGCAAQAPRQALAPPVHAAAPSAKAGGSNRFDMIQNGRRMTADDFDAWMKARGIRIAQGAPAKKRPAPAAQARPDRRTRRR